MLHALADAPARPVARLVATGLDHGFACGTVRALRRKPAHERRRNLVEEARRDVVADLSMQHPALRVREVEPPAGPRNRNVREPALLFDAVVLRKRVLVREDAL